MALLLATHNPHKAQELVGILGDTNVLTIANLTFVIAEPIEDGATLEENAYIKGREVYLATGLPTVADDTGLEVDALGGEPGVRSARFAGDMATYSDNCRLLLERMSGQTNRRARFRTVVCYCDGLRTFLVEGEIAGTIAKAPRGSGGFGYDSLFIPDGHNRTFAEMPPEEKNIISHRARALRALREVLSEHAAPNE